MKYYILYQENNDFTSFLEDPAIQNNCKNFLRWNQHLLIIFDENLKEDIKSYILLKYGDNIKSANTFAQDFTPVPYKDYTPIKSVLPSVRKIK